MSIVPDSHRDLLDRPLFAHLATIRPDGSPQVNPMWFTWDGDLLYFSTSSSRQKYRNVAAHPEVAISITDPDSQYRYLEVRGVLERIDPDTAGEFCLAQADRYDMAMDGPPPDVEFRVVLVVRPTASSYQ